MDSETKSINSLERFFKTHISASGTLEQHSPEALDSEKYYYSPFRGAPEKTHIFIFFDSALKAVKQFNNLISRYNKEATYFELSDTDIANWIDTYKSELQVFNLLGCKLMLSKGVSLYRIDISLEIGYSWHSVNSIDSKRPLEFSYPFTSPVNYDFPDYNTHFSTKEAIMLLSVLFTIQQNKSSDFCEFPTIFSGEDLEVFIHTKDFKSFWIYYIFNILDKNKDPFQSPALETILKTLIIEFSKFQLLTVSYQLMMTPEDCLMPQISENNILKLIRTKIPLREIFQEVSRLNKYFEIQDGEFILFVAMQKQLEVIKPYLHEFSDLEDLYFAMVEASDETAVKVRKLLVGDMPLNLIERPTNIKVNEASSPPKNSYNPEAIAYNNSAIKKMNDQDFDAAINDFQNAIDCDKYMLPAYMTLTSLKINYHQDYNYVITLIDDFISLEGFDINPDPLYASLYFNRGLAKSYLEQEQEAVVDFTKAIQIDSNYPESYGSRAVSLMHLGDYLAALEDFNKAIELKPKSASDFLNRSKCKQSLADFEGAFEDCEIAFELEPLNPVISERKMYMDTLKSSDLWDLLNNFNEDDESNK